MDSTQKVAAMRAFDLPGLCRALADSSPMPTAAMDGAGHIVRYANPAFCRLLGKAREELTGRAFHEVAPAGRECLALLDRVYQTGEPETHTGEEHSAAHQVYWSYTMWPVAPAEAVAAEKGRAGIVIQIAESGLFHEDAIAMNQALMVGSIRQHELTEEAERLNRQLHTEMVERRQAENALRESEERFRMIADNMAQLAWTCDVLGNVTWYNQRWLDYTGLSLEDMKGWDWRKVQHPEHVARVVAHVKHSSETGEVWEDIFPLRGKDGQYRWFLSRAVPIHDAEGKIVRWFGTNTDITEQRQVEEALRRSEKLAATGRLAATMAHEINNPLESVTNLLYLAREDSSMSIQTHQRLLLADRELDRVAHITRQTLGFYRDPAAPTPVDVSRTVSDLIEVYSYRFRSRHIHVEKELDVSAKIVASAGELRQVVSNLFLNAIDATPPGGRIRIQVRPAWSWNGSGRAGVRITIADTGSGIDPSHRARLFDAFFTTKREIGNGLGLWFSQNMVQKHGGRIQLRSSIQPEKRGTVFSVFWPDESEADDAALRETA